MIGNNQKSLLNVMKKELFKRDSTYQEVDQKCQSFKSFNNLMNSNQFFSEFKSNKRRDMEAPQGGLQRGDT